MTRPLAVDLFTGLHGWAEGLVSRGWRVVGFDVEDMCANFNLPRPQHVQLVIQDVLTLHGSQFRSADLIVASPPCQFFSYCAMPWSRAKALAQHVRSDPARLARETALFDACFRIQREACEAAGRHIPLIVENVRGAIPWVGRSRWNYGSYHLWGDVPALMPATFKGHKVPSFRFDGSGRSFQTAAVNETGRKSSGMNWSDPTKRGQDFTRVAGRQAMEGVKGDGSGRRENGTLMSCNRMVPDGIKQGGSWFHDAQGISRTTSGKSSARKAASAMIAKIPAPLAAHIAVTFYPREYASCAE